MKTKFIKSMFISILMISTLIVGTVYAGAGGGYTETPINSGDVTNLGTWKQDEDNNWYIIDKQGNALLGWHQVNNIWYYFGNDGKRESGWISYNGKLYYLDANGKMLTGYQLIYEYGVSNLYLINNDGSMYTGWRHNTGESNYWNYFTPSGYMADGWYKVNGNWYFFGKDGIMQTNTTIDGYILDSSGRWINQNFSSAATPIVYERKEYTKEELDKLAIKIPQSVSGLDFDITTIPKDGKLHAIGVIGADLSVTTKYIKYYYATKNYSGYTLYYLIATVYDGASSNTRYRFAALEEFTKNP